MDSFNWNDFFSGIGGIADKYTNYRLVQATNALQADGQAQAAAANQAAMLPAWVMPAAVLGGLALTVLLVVRR